MINELDDRYHRYEKFGAYHWKALRMFLFRDHWTHLRYSVASKYVSKNCIVLDVGCGDAAFFPFLISKKIFHYIGADLSSTGLRLAKQMFISRLKKAKTAYDLVLCDARLLPFKTGSLNVITNLEVLEHTDTPLIIVKEIARVLKARSTCIFSITFYERLQQFLPLLSKIFKKVHTQGFFPKHIFNRFVLSKNNKQTLRLIRYGFRYILLTLLVPIYKNKHLEPSRSSIFIVLCKGFK